MYFSSFVQMFAHLQLHRVDVDVRFNTRIENLAAYLNLETLISKKVNVACMGPVLIAQLKKTPRTLRSIDTTFGYSTQCRFRFDENGLEIQCVLPQYLALCTFRLKRESFHSYFVQPKQCFEFCMPVQHIQKFLKNKEEKRALVEFCSENGSRLCLRPMDLVLQKRAPSSNGKAGTQSKAGAQSKRRKINDFYKPEGAHSTTESSDPLANRQWENGSHSFDSEGELPHQLQFDEGELMQRKREGERERERERERETERKKRETLVCPNTDKTLLLNQYFQLPQDFDDYDFSIMMYAEEMSRIFREVSTVGNIVSIGATPAHRQVAFRVSGELGQSTIRFFGSKKRVAKNDIQVTFGKGREKQRENTNTATAPNGVSGKKNTERKSDAFSEEFANRLVRFFDKILQPPLLVRLYVCEKRPLILTVCMDPSQKNTYMHTHIVPHQYLLK